ncbi:MAG: hypothetical protein MK212_04460 [Saprospiraceae bacterium]|nr:hypothetical protein [Saprospiraceae bacterium]
MKNITISCNECGVQTKLPSSTKFYTCFNCQTSLKVLQLNNTYYTEKHTASAPIDKPKPKKKYDFSMKLKETSPLDELHNLDKEWDYFKSNSTFMGFQIDGDFQVAANLFSFVFGISLILELLSIVFIGWAAIVPIIISMLGLGLVASFHCFGMINTYQTTLIDYQNRRDQLWKKLGSLREMYRQYY